MNIVVTNLKGGVGKTTTAVYLSAVAAARGYDPVMLIDADRQASRPSGSRSGHRGRDGRRGAV